MSDVRRTAWEEEIGIATMRPVAPAADPERRVELGRERPALRTRDHAAIVYWDARELLGSVVPYLVEGLRAGDKVVYVADDQPIDTIRDALASAGVDVDAASAEGRLVLLTAAQAFFPEGRFDVDAALRGVQELAAAAARDGFARVRFSVEMTYLLADVPGMERGAEFEARANEEVFAKFPFVCICSFNGNRDDGRALKDVLATHPVLLSNGLPLVNPYYRAWKDLRDDRARPRRDEAVPLASDSE